VETIQDELKYVSPSQVSINPFQPRKEFNNEELAELADSIRTVGILHPPLVRPLPQEGHYELISGERRFRAAQLASLSTIPVYIRITDAVISAQAALIENIQRVDLNPLEIAKALRKLILEFSYTQECLAKRIGKKRSTVANYLRLLTLHPQIQECLLKNQISMGHAKAILSVEKEIEQFLLLRRIVDDKLNVREAEEAAHTFMQNDVRKTTKSKKINQTAVYIEDITNRFREKLGTHVSIKGNGEQGQICIPYYDLDDLDRLLAFFGIAENV
jgi:ParB family transcriptional regulator, chromosome partitioning protein